MDYFDDYIDFEWDDDKAFINEQKHGVSFEDAIDVFSDPFARVVPDVIHSQTEERFHILGLDLKTRVLLVCFCERNEGNTLRLISARKATKNEEKQYWKMR